MDDKKKEVESPEKKKDDGNGKGEITVGNLAENDIPNKFNSASPKKIEGNR